MGGFARPRRSSRPELRTLGALSLVRAAIGVARLAFPDTVIPGLDGDHVGPGARRLVRVLGIRQVGQALLTGRAPPPAVVWLGIEIDIAHAASMIVLGALAPRYRRDAFGDALVAAVLAASGIAAVRTATAGSAGASGLTRWRDRRAESLAHRLVPGLNSGPRGAI